MRLSQAQSRKIAAGIILGFFVVGAIFLLSRPKGGAGRAAENIDSTPISVDSQPQPGAAGPGGVLEGFHRVETKNGRPLWEISADRGEYIAASGGVKLFSPKMTLFRGDKPVGVSAGEAIVYLEGAGLRSAELSKSVIIQVDPETTITTELASYDRPSDNIAAPGKVQVTGQMIEVSGGFLRGSVQKNEFTIAGGVQSVIHPDKKSHDQ